MGRGRRWGMAVELSSLRRGVGRRGIWEEVCAGVGEKQCRASADGCRRCGVDQGAAGDARLQTAADG